MEPPTASIGGDVRRWISAFGLIRFLLALVALVAFLILWRQAKGQLFRALDVHFILLFQLLLLSWPWRTVSLKMVAFFFFLGMGPVSYLILLSSPFLDNLFVESGISKSLNILINGWGGSAYALMTFWAPVTEEIFKVLPLVLLLILWKRSGLRTQSSSLDLGILAAATGAGFGFAEDVHKIGIPYWRAIGPNVQSWVFPFSHIPLLGTIENLIVKMVQTLDLSPFRFYPGTMGGGRGLFTPFPEMLGGDPVIFLGHGTLPLAFGLALGMAIYGARRFKSRLVYLIYLVPGLILLWNIWEHVMANSWREDETFSLLNLLGPSDLHGRLLLLFLIFGWIGAILISRKILRQHADPKTAFSWRELKYEVYKSRGLLGPLTFLRDLLTFLRLRRQTAYGFFHLKGSSGEEQSRKNLSLLATRTQAALLALRLQGKPLPTISPEEQRALDRATPVA